MKASNSKKYFIYRKAFKKRQKTIKKMGHITNEANVVMIKWKGMTSRVPLSSNTIVQTYYYFVFRPVPLLGFLNGTP